MTLSITPETKIGELLQAYPQLEQKLVEITPVFEKLKNPVLRRTVTKVATLRTAAKMAGIDVGHLVQTLRHTVGQGDGTEVGGITPGPADRSVGDLPDWARNREVHATIDGDRLLDAGEHPLAFVWASLRTSPAGTVVLLTTGFRPEPLIETFAGESYRIVCREVPGRGWETYISKP